MTDNKYADGVGDTSKSQVSVDMVRRVGEGSGVMKVQEEAAKLLAEHTTFYLRMIVSEAQTFSILSKSRQLTANNIRNAFDSVKIPLETSYGHEVPVYRHIRSGTRDVYISEDKDVDIEKLLEAPIPKLPCEVMIKSHWLSVEGVEPSVSDNPPRVSKREQQLESLDPDLRARNFDVRRGDKLLSDFGSCIKVREQSAHDLSMEQQSYYIQITEACVGTDETRRAQALRSLATEPGLYQLLPRFSLFILEGVKLNVANNNLAMLIYLMRMVKSMLENPSLYLEKYLHQIIPAVTTCIVCKQLCMRPEADNHWALRDFAARLLAQICKTFDTTVNNVLPRTCRLFVDKVSNENSPLVTLYGIFHFFVEAGQEVMLSCAIPLLRTLGERLKVALETAPNSIQAHSRSAADRLKAIIPKKVAEVLKQVRQPPDVLEDYKKEFGYLGPLIHAAVLKARMHSSGHMHSASGVSSMPGSMQVMSISRPVSAPSTQNNRPLNMYQTVVITPKH